MSQSPTYLHAARPTERIDPFSPPVLSPSLCLILKSLPLLWIPYPTSKFCYMLVPSRTCEGRERERSGGKAREKVWEGGKGRERDLANDQGREGERKTHSRSKDKGEGVCMGGGSWGRRVGGLTVSDCIIHAFHFSKTFSSQNKGWVYFGSKGGKNLFPSISSRVNKYI